MINALLSIALVQSLGYAADLRLALRGDGFDDGYNLDARYRLDHLFPTGLPLLLRLRLAQLFLGFRSLGFTAGFLGQPESRLFRQSGRARCQLFTGSTPQ